MHKFLLAAVAATALAFAGTVGAKTVVVSITKNGYVPNTMTIASGDSVQFTNADTAVHQVAFKPTTGVTCTPNPVVVAPAQTATCTFATAGTYTYSDPNVKGKTYRGTVVVTGAAATAVTLAAKPLLVVYGGKSTLTGTLANQRAGENVDILATSCGQTAAAKVTTVQTTTGGAFAAVVQPLNRTVYTAKVRNSTSPGVTVKVRPRLRLGKVAAHRYTLRVTAAQSFAGKYGTFQRYNGTLKRWVNVKRVLLRANATGVAPTVATSASFRATVPVRARVRVTLPQLQVGACYAPGLSNTIFG
ncbi:MAG: cupredoxin domain-containing protein [Actinobacteria bacterium]|nr:cupredoxin domain-containing protein [Actinomycetota bacterium]